MSENKDRRYISSQRARKLRRKDVYTCIDKAGKQYWVPEPGQCTKESAQKVQHNQ